jgi:ABC-type phosphate transport system substrate-binding protein
MTKLKTRILTTACIALAGSSMLSSAALAAVTQVYGGGSSLIAPYWRQVGDCYGNPTALIYTGTPPTFANITPFDFVGTTPANSQNCATKHISTKYTVNFISTGSGTGIEGIYSHNPDVYGFVDAGETMYYPTVNYGLSDSGLADSDVAIYNGGGTEHGATVVAPGVTPGAGQYGNPLQLYGPLIQFPFSIDPVVIAYSPVYEKVYNPSTPSTPTTYSFNIKSSYLRSNGSGGLHLDATTYCEIFNGQITNWNSPALKKLNGGQSLEDPTDPTPAASWSVPMQIVGREDSSGTTSIFYRNLATVCGALISGNNYVAAGGTTLPSGLLDAGETSSVPGYNKANPNYPAPAIETLGKFTTANGSDGVSKYVAFTALPSDGIGGDNPTTIIQGRIGYVGPDYALPAVLSTNQNSYGLNTATLKNSLGQWIVPTPAAALKSFSVLSPPSGSAATDPANWVQPIANTSPLGNPTVSGGYPIVGTTNFLGYTCYASSKNTTLITGMIKYVESNLINTDTSTGILAEAGLSPLPKAWTSAIEATFESNTSGLGLNISTVGAAGACSVAGVVGG